MTDKITVKLPITLNESELKRLAAKKLRYTPQFIKICKKSLDARDKGNIFWSYTLECSSKPITEDEKREEQIKCNPHIVIVGTGPCGLFAAVKLIKYGFKPTVIERGEPVEERVKTTSVFFNNRQLNPDSNIQFGEGGAGTFSDGKLNTQVNGKYNMEVLKTFVEFGADKEIEYLNKPHIGSDKLPAIVKNMREYVISNGGKVLFNTLMTDIKICGDRVESITVKDVKTGKEDQLRPDELILAIGHSSRDTFEMLSGKNIVMKQKEFAVGFRIEHLQKSISYSQYGENAKHLPAADYKLVSHTQQDRSAFTFCMCPGGYVMASSSEEGMLVVNGMSEFLRDGENANSALIAQVKYSDFDGDDPLAGVRFQRRYEKKAFEMGGGNYNAPVQKVGDFLSDRDSSSFGEVKPTYSIGTTFAPLNEMYPEEITNALKSAIVDMDKRLKGFACPDAVLSGVETRTSSPVQLTRNENMQSVSITNMYPCGEGAGYAGGITSAAADGLKVAYVLFEKYKNM